jgi:hypothetical protein
LNFFEPKRRTHAGWWIHAAVARKAINELVNNPGLFPGLFPAGTGPDAQAIYNIANNHPAYAAVGAIGPELFFRLPRRPPLQYAPRPRQGAVMKDGFETLFNEQPGRVLSEPFLVHPTGKISSSGRVRRFNRAGEIIIGDEVLKILQENRFGLAKGKTTKLSNCEGRESNKAHYVFPLTCVLHPHPECYFRWAQLEVDLTHTEGAIIRDLFPCEVQSDRPTELKSGIGVGLKFKLLQAASVEPKLEYSTNRSVYYPKITSSGVNFRKASWSFLSKSGESIPASQELYLLISAPANVPVLATFDMKANVQFGDGFFGFLLRREGAIKGSYLIT